MKLNEIDEIKLKSFHLLTLISVENEAQLKWLTPGSVND